MRSGDGDAQHSGACGSRSSSDRLGPPRPARAPSWLPSLALWAFCFSQPLVLVLPTKVVEYLPPLSVWLIALWWLASPRPFARRGSTAWQASAFVLVAWAILGSVTQTHWTHPMLWVTDLAVGTILATSAARVSSAATQRLLYVNMCLAGIVVGLASLIERMRHKSLFYSLYAQWPDYDPTHWASFRAQFGFGHPLVDGTFLACMATVSLGFMLWRTFERPTLPLLAFVISCAGIASTASRSALVGLLAGIVMVALVFIRRARSTFGTRFLSVALGALAIGAVAISPFVSDRIDSREATSSAHYRQANADFALHLMRDNHWLGTGTATSEAAAKAAGSLTPIESRSWLWL